ncbi:MAG: alginate export family protein [Gemmatimonadetes bacterium]|nr:alginate export family protein [Gemmatimonadota bacterium]
MRQLVMCALLATRVMAQAAQPAPAPSVTVGASTRMRAESWNWYDAGSEGEYTFASALSRLFAAGTSKRLAWRAELNVPAFAGLPTDAVLPAPRGQLGMGAAYVAGNNTRSSVAQVVLRQLWGEVRGSKGSLRFGRMEYSDGLERAPRSPVLTTLKATRIAQRVIGPFTYTQVQRSLDGALATARIGGSTFQAVVARPTSGVFTAVEAGHTLDVNLAYGAWGRGFGSGAREADVRLFGIWYDDNRATIPTDNRPLATRTSASREIAVQTAGGHLVASLPNGSVSYDLMLWAAAQRGTWSGLDHRGYGLATEAGVQWPRVRWSPWLRAGQWYGSGDGDATDNEHGTFFQLLPTPRPYARFPFYNSMNTHEWFGYLTLRPTRTHTARVSLHRVDLTNASDAWYIGGGAYDARNFGFNGRPSNNEHRLGQLLDASVEWRPNTHLTVELFAARNWGNRVASRIYSADGSGTLAYLEVSLTR